MWSLKDTDARGGRPARRYDWKRCGCADVCDGPIAGDADRFSVGADHLAVDERCDRSHAWLPDAGRARWEII